MQVMNRPLRLEDSSIAKADAFIDIGANIGWFSLNMACAGHPTFAFEAMPENQMLMRASMCQNTYKGRPECMQHLTLVPAGLGAKRDHCKLVSGWTELG